MHARLCLTFAAMLTLSGCAWHYPMPVYPPFPPDHGYSAPYDPHQPYAAAPNDAALLQQAAPLPGTGG